VDDVRLDDTPAGPRVTIRRGAASDTVTVAGEHLTITAGDKTVLTSH
jgi:hypothetical protein